MLVLSLLAWFYGTSASASSTVFFEDVALCYRRGQITCWHLDSPPPARLTRATTTAIVKWSSFYWPKRQDRWSLAYRLVLSEDEGRDEGNPHDPSYGVGGVMVSSVHIVYKRFGSMLGPIRWPSTANGARRRLNEDVDFNIMVMLGELAICLEKSDGREEQAILKYKLGVNHSLQGPKADRRRKAFRQVTSNYRCVEKVVRCDPLAASPCECMK